VLLGEAVDLLDVRPGGFYLDGTFGAGGHTREIVARGGRVLAFDVDASATLPDDLAGAATLVHANFANLADELDARGLERVDGVLFDVGVSSMQIDEPERGFSFSSDGPIDMRMSGSGRSAYDLLSDLDERELADLIYTYGEERASRRIARAIVNARERGALPTGTAALAALVARASGARGYWRIHPATRTFQALRIAVNDELDSLRRGLAAATERTRIGGRIAIISFHSLEDRIVKTTFRDDPRLHALTKKPILPSAEESARNPRARSAKLRGAERTA
jgi:16S rRNA (cytosine1402-N4)-methyltransferase